MSKANKTTRRSPKSSDSESDNKAKPEVKDDDLWPLLLSSFSDRNPESRLTTDVLPPKTALAEHLENFSRNWISIWNARDWANPLLTLNVAPNMKFSFHCLDTGRTVTYHGIHETRKLIQSLLARPAVQMSPISVVAEIHPPSVAANGKRMKRNAEESSYATVWCVLQVSGVPEGILRETSAVFYYRKEKDGRWLMAGYKSFTNRPPLWDGLDGPYFGDEEEDG